MGLIQKIRNAWEMRNRTISTVTMMTEHGNQYVSWGNKVYDFDVVRACIRPKVKAIGKLVGKHIRETLTEDGSRNIETNPSVNIRMLLEEPNPLMTGQDLQEKVATQLAINKNAFVLISRDEMGTATALYPIVPHSVEARYHAGALYLRFFMPNNKTFEFPYTDIIHLRDDFNENDVFGTPIAPVLVPLLDVVSTTDQGIVHAIKNSSVVRWLLKYSNVLRREDLKDNAKEFAESFLATSSGTGVAAIGGNCEAVQIEPKDYVPNAEQIDRTTKRIYDLFNTNEKIINSSATEDEKEAYFDSEIEPDIKKLSGEYTRKLFSRRERARGNRIVFEASSWDGASLTTKLNLREMVDRGAMTPNEWRYAFNLAPVAGGDTPIRRLDTAQVTVGGGE